MSWLSLLWIPIATALIGWFTNWIAVCMLFRPYEIWRILGFEWQGVLPSRHGEIAEKLSVLIERELINQDVICQGLNKIDIKSHLEAYSHKLLHEHIGKKLTKIPLLGPTINKTSLSLLEKLSSEAIQKDIEPTMRKQLAKDLDKYLQIKSLVKARILKFEIGEMESLIKEIAKKELQFIEWIGGLLGFVIGILQILVILFFYR